MISLFESVGNKQMVQRIESLTSESKPGWGKMTVGQMCKHCQLPFRLAKGESKLKRGLIGFFLGGWAKKKFVIGPDPFNRNAPTGPEFIVTGEQEFSAEQKKLVELCLGFAELGPDGVTKESHPFFGPMTHAEWDRLMFKHLDHHLRQFSV